MRFFFLLISLAFSLFQFGARAQDASGYGIRTAQPDDTVKRAPGKISIHASQDILRLDSLKRLKPTLPDGYRVQIYFGKREGAQEKRAVFLRQYPETGAYISYLAPNFRLRVGDFRSRIEAEKFKQTLAFSFPGAYLVKDKIELPPIPERSSN